MRFGLEICLILIKTAKQQIYVLTIMAQVKLRLYYLYYQFTCGYMISVLLFASHQVLRLPNYIHTYLYNNCDFFLNSVYANPPCQLSLWEETGAPEENPRLEAELDRLKI